MKHARQTNSNAAARTAAARKPARAASATGTVATPPNRRRHARTALFSVAGALLVAWGVGSYHFTSHFVSGTTVNGVDASNLTVSQLADKVEQSTQTYTNHITGDGFDLVISAQDINLDSDGRALAEKARQQSHALLWPIELLNTPKVHDTSHVRYDADTLARLVTDAVESFNARAAQPTDATAAYDAEQGAFVVVPSQLGEALDAQAVIDELDQSLRVLSPTTTLGEAQLLRAGVPDDDAQLAAAIDEANAMCAMEVPLTLDGKTLYTLTPDLIAQWVSIVNEGYGPKVSVDQQAIFQWSYDNMNAVVNGENETRTWEVNSWDLSLALEERLAKKDASALEFPTITTETRPDESEGHETRGRHVDVNLSTQYARLYADDGKKVLWRSYFVSGNLAQNHCTPTGEFHINSMERDVVLTGLNDGVELKEGEEPKPEDFYESHVDYWMCFLGTEVGLHDASWRYDWEFGGDTYTWNGSHGCVNLPVEAAKELYGLLKVGDTVYIHW